MTDMDNVRGERRESSSTGEPRLMPDLEKIRRLREEFHRAEREKAEIYQRLANIRELRRRLIGP